MCVPDYCMKINIDKKCRWKLWC